MVIFHRALDQADLHADLAVGAAGGTVEVEIH